MKQNNFQSWLKKLKKSGKSDEEISSILYGIAQYSQISIYEAILPTLPKKEVALVEACKSEHESFGMLQQFFKKSTGMTLDALVARIQILLIEGKHN